MSGERKIKIILKVLAWNEWMDLVERDEYYLPAFYARIKLEQLFFSILCWVSTFRQVLGFEKKDA